MFSVCVYAAPLSVMVIINSYSIYLYPNYSLFQAYISSSYSFFFFFLSEAGYNNKECGIHAIVTIILFDNLCYNVVLLWAIDKGFLRSGKVCNSVKALRISPAILVILAIQNTHFSIFLLATFSMQALTNYLFHPLPY
jgi:hypothetical protein